MRTSRLSVGGIAAGLLLVAGPIAAAAALAEAYRYEPKRHDPRPTFSGPRNYRRGGGKATPAWFKGSRWAKRAHRRGGNPARFNPYAGGL